jgi:hypothetical protein
VATFGWGAAPGAPPPPPPVTLRGGGGSLKWQWKDKERKDLVIDLRPHIKKKAQIVKTRTVQEQAPIEKEVEVIDLRFDVIKNMMADIDRVKGELLEKVEEFRKKLFATNKRLLVSVKENRILRGRVRNLEARVRQLESQLEALEARKYEQIPMSVKVALWLIVIGIALLLITVYSSQRGGRKEDK